MLMISFFYLFPMTGQGAELEDSYLSYKGQGEFQLNSDDLLAKFKGIMPGDQLKQTLIIKNDSDKAVDMNLSLVSTDPVDLIFLKQLNVTFRKGNDMLYSGTINQMTDKKGITLGYFKIGEEKEYQLDLEVPLQLDNKYNGYVTTSEWTFVATATQDTTPSEEQPNKPKPGIPNTKPTSPSYGRKLPQTNERLENWQWLGGLLLAVVLLSTWQKRTRKIT